MTANLSLGESRSKSCCRFWVLCWRKLASHVPTSFVTLLTEPFLRPPKPPMLPLANRPFASRTMSSFCFSMSMLFFLPITYQSSISV